MTLLKAVGMFLLRLVGIPTLITVVFRLFDSVSAPFGTQWTLIFFFFLLFEGIRRQLDQSLLWANKDDKDDTEN